MLIRIIGIGESFQHHKGRPGERGGSVAKDSNDALRVTDMEKKQMASLPIQESTPQGTNGVTAHNLGSAEMKAHEDKLVNGVGFIMAQGFIPGHGMVTNLISQSKRYPGYFSSFTIGNSNKEQYHQTAKDALEFAKDDMFNGPMPKRVSAKRAQAGWS